MRSPSDTAPGELQALPPAPRARCRHGQWLQHTARERGWQDTVFLKDVQNRGVYCDLTSIPFSARA